MLLAPTPNIESFTARDLEILPPEERDELVEQAIKYWRQKGFPFRQLNNVEIAHSYAKIFNSDTKKVLVGDKIRGSILGLDVVNSFHPQIWHAVRWGHLKSPIDHFNDDNTFRKLLVRSIKLWPDRKCWSGSTVRAMFRIYSGGRVSNFRPTVSKAIIEQFSIDGDTVLDFCAGFGGRLLGCLPLKRHYIGIDPSINQINSNKKMYAAIKPYAPCFATFYIGCAEEVMPRLPAASVDLIFTSPPYFKQEKYNKEANQSYLRYSDFELWKTSFLLPVIIQSERILKPGGFFVINIANIRNYRLADEFEKIAGNFFKLAAFYQLEMTVRPLHRKSGASKFEPVFVFRKPL